MSDIKRVILTSLEPQKVSEKPVKPVEKTVRIRVSLVEPNEDKCPVFSYKDELAVAKKKNKQTKELPNNVTNGTAEDIFGDENDDDVRRIAMEMEAKYGTGVITKKKRKGRKDDYADIGAGYDESDSFIDNTDGYDEIIPPNVTTARGGFYINSGALEFKIDEEASSEVSSSSSSEDSDKDDEDDDDEKSSTVVKRKKPLDSTEDEEETGDDKKVKHSQSTQINQFSKQETIKSLNPERINKKRKLSLHKHTVSELLRTNGVVLPDGSKENKTPMRMSSVQDAIDSVLGRPELDGIVQAPTSEKSTLVASTPTTVVPVTEVVLPENLPRIIIEIVDKLKQTAKDFKGDGFKVKFFNDNVNNLLLKLERECKVLGRTSRMRVFEHLAPFLQCRKESLINRAKKLVYEAERKKLQQTLNLIKNRVESLMPLLIKDYEKDCQRVLQKKLSDDAAKDMKMPRRRFPLHEDHKRMFREVVSYKKRCLLHEGVEKQDLETRLLSYFKSHVLVLWPDGWMSMNVLKKYCTALAIKTPDPKTGVKQQSHSEKSSSSAAPFVSKPNLTITPINLTDKLSRVEKLKTTTTTESTTIHPIIVPEKTEKSDPNGVIVLSATKQSVIEPVHCPEVIDLTDSPSMSDNKPSKRSIIIDEPKSKVNNSQIQSDREDVLKVMESLKALQKMSSPVKTEKSNPAVSVIAFNKTYLNSTNSDTSNDRMSFGNTIGYQNEFQKQIYLGSLNHKTSPTPSSSSSKSGYNGCS